MEKNLLKELKDLLNLVDSFRKELSKVSSKKEGFKAVNQHIDTAINESEEATKKLIDIIGDSLEKIQQSIELVSKLEGSEKEVVLELLNSVLNNLMNALTFLEFQDIMAQRLLKVRDFLIDLEKSLVRVALIAGLEDSQGEEREEIKKKLEELEWKKEVSQSDVDEIMKQFGL